MKTVYLLTLQKKNGIKHRTVSLFECKERGQKIVDNLMLRVEEEGDCWILEEAGLMEECKE